MADDIRKDLENRGVIIEDKSNSGNSKNKNHFFANSKINLINGFFKDSKLEFNIQKLSNDTYLKAYNITSNLISSTSTLVSYIDFQGSDEINSLTANLKVYEDLSKKHSEIMFTCSPFGGPGADWRPTSHFYRVVIDFSSIFHKCSVFVFIS